MKRRRWSSHAATNYGNGTSPRQPARNEHILAYRAQHPEASLSEIGRAVGATRNVVAGVLGRARAKAADAGGRSA